MEFALYYDRSGNGSLLSQQSGEIVERVYATTNDGTDVAYFERIDEVYGRGTGNSYERHRHAKGDTMEVSRSVACRFVSDTLSQEAVLAAIGVTEKDIVQANDDNGGGLFVAVSRKARGGHPTWYGSTPKNEVSRLKKIKESAIFEIK